MKAGLKSKLAGAILFLSFSVPAPAQEGEPLPPWAVPVLRLVSATHVEPTTGIVVSSDGLVLVPQGFASSGDEIVVLDGGTDIVRNGRPAEVDRRLDYVGLKLLRVEGLNRRPPIFAENPPVNGTQLWLNAFPPAERIAEGEKPLNVERRLLRTPGSGPNGLSFNAPLPNVTGALVDSCGYVLGISIHSGVQDMAPSPATRYRWAAEVQDALNAKQVDTRTDDCGPADTTRAETPGESPASKEDPGESPGEPAEELPDTLPGEDTGSGEDAEESTEGEIGLALPEEDGQGLENLQRLPPEEPGVEPRSHWPWLLLAALLITGGLGVHGWRKRNATSPHVPETGSEGSDETAGEPEWQPPPMTHRLVISGQDEQGRVFLADCPVSDRAINCVVGSGQVDLVIDHPAISRSHARLFGTADTLLLSDLESATGTSVNEVPCLDGETLYVEDGNIIGLGPLRFTVSLEPAD